MLAPAHVGLFDAHDLHAFEALHGPSLMDVELDAPPQLIALAARQRRNLSLSKIAETLSSSTSSAVISARALADSAHTRLVGDSC